MLLLSSNGSQISAEHQVYQIALLIYINQASVPAVTPGYFSLCHIDTLTSLCMGITLDIDRAITAPVPVSFT